MYSKSTLFFYPNYVKSYQMKGIDVNVFSRLRKRWLSPMVAGIALEERCVNASERR